MLFLRIASLATAVSGILGRIIYAGVNEVLYQLIPNKHLNKEVFAVWRRIWCFWDEGPRLTWSVWSGLCVYKQGILLF